MPCHAMPCHTTYRNIGNNKNGVLRYVVALTDLLKTEHEIEVVCNKRAIYNDMTEDT